MQLVSICIPTYNGEKYLKEAIESVLIQTYNNLEILCVDDCSTDNTIEILRNYGQRDSRIRIIENEKNLGLVGNWNKCLQFAKGEWIQFLFQDDWMEPDCIEEMYTNAVKFSKPFVLCDRNYFTEDSTISTDFYNRILERVAISTNYYTPEYISQKILNNYLGWNFLGEPIAGLFNRSLLDKYGFFNNMLQQISDFEYWSRFAVNEGVVFINRRLVSFRLHKDSTSKKNSKTYASVIDKIILGNDFINKEYYTFLQGIAERQGVKLDNLFYEKIQTFFINHGDIIEKELKKVNSDIVLKINFKTKTKRFIKKIISWLINQ